MQLLTQPLPFHGGPPHPRRNTKRVSVHALQSDKMSLTEAAKMVCSNSLISSLIIVHFLGNSFFAYKDASLCIARVAEP